MTPLAREVPTLHDPLSHRGGEGVDLETEGLGWHPPVAPLSRSTMADRDVLDPVASLPHRRYNPLTGEWLLVSAGRTSRPWRGGTEAAPADSVPSFDPSCYLCPGVERAVGAVNPKYESTFIFTNDYAALRPDATPGTFSDGLLRAEVQRGTCRVICFSPRHDLPLSRMSPVETRLVVDLWADQTAELGRDWKWVQVFENRGAAMGASNPHPHGQIWAGDVLPREAAREDATQERHYAAAGRSLLLDYAAQESGGPRALVENDDWLVVVPFWAVWPFETMVLPRRPVGRIPDLRDGERGSLAASLVSLLRGYDALFDTPFPYSMGWHQAPFDGIERPYWQLHAHFYPPLLRGASVRKFMVGYELLSESQRDITAEEAASRIRDAMVSNG
jgi:UDPglucose--hexose-1-phosphate uridylyltransferase